MLITCKNCGKIPRSEICECGKKIHISEKIFQPYYNPVDMQIEHDFHEIVLFIMAGLHNNPNYIRIKKCEHRQRYNYNDCSDSFMILFSAPIPQVFFPADRGVEDIEIEIHYLNIDFYSLEYYSMTIRSPRINYDINLSYRPINTGGEEDDVYSSCRIEPDNLGDYVKCQIISNLLPKVDWDKIPCIEERDY